MGGSPIEDDSYSGVVTTIDEIHEVCGLTIPAGGGVIAKGLVAPRAVEGMLHDWEQFDVGGSEIFYIGYKLIAEFFVGYSAIFCLRDAPLRAQMHLVDENRRFEPIFLRPFLDPFGVIPFVFIQIGDDGTGVWPQLGAKSVRIGFERKQIAGGADDFELIDGAFD